MVKELLGYVKANMGDNAVEAFVKNTNEKGESALHYAARIKKANLHFPDEDRLIIKLLMEHGSDVFMQTKDVSSYVYYLCV